MNEGKLLRRATFMMWVLISFSLGAALVLLAKVKVAGSADVGDWIQFSGGMTGAGLTVLGAYWLEKRRTELALTRERMDATEEILTAAAEALEIYDTVCGLLEPEAWGEDAMATERARAEHIYLSLDRLISRPFLTDGAIITGAGAMTVAKAIASIPSRTDLMERRTPTDAIDALISQFVTAQHHAERSIAALQQTVKVVRERAERVRRHHHIEPPAPPLVS